METLFEAVPGGRLGVAVALAVIAVLILAVTFWPRPRADRERDEPVVPVADDAADLSPTAALSGVPSTSAAGDDVEESSDVEVSLDAEHGDQARDDELESLVTSALVVHGDLHEETDAAQDVAGDVDVPEGRWLFRAEMLQPALTASVRPLSLPAPMPVDVPPVDVVGTEDGDDLEYAEPFDVALPVPGAAPADGPVEGDPVQDSVVDQAPETSDSPALVPSDDSLEDAAEDGAEEPVVEQAPAYGAAPDARGSALASRILRRRRGEDPAVTARREAERRAEDERRAAAAAALLSSAEGVGDPEEDSAEQVDLVVDRPVAPAGWDLPEPLPPKF